MTAPRPSNSLSKKKKPAMDQRTTRLVNLRKNMEFAMNKDNSKAFEEWERKVVEVTAY